MNAFIDKLLAPLPEGAEPVVTPAFKVELARMEMDRMRTDAIEAMARYATLKAVAEIRAGKGEAA